MNILVTGAAGFIGYHTMLKFVKENYNVTGIDNFNSYYSPELKRKRIENLPANSVYCLDVNNINSEKFDHIDVVVHLAAQAGVRYSLTHPEIYIKDNVSGFLAILEFCRQNNVRKLIYASSSSVYGNRCVPTKETDPTSNPISLYATTKKTNELMAYNYSHLYNLQTIGLRFFTCYGPWGRPDMAMWLFADAMLQNKKINVNNYGLMSRDWTYVQDTVEAIYYFATSTTLPPFATIYNVGSGKSVSLMRMIEKLAQHLETTAKINFMPMQPGDVKQSLADISLIKKIIPYEPKVCIDAGIKAFADWFKKEGRFF